MSIQAALALVCIGLVTLAVVMTLLRMARDAYKYRICCRQCGGEKKLRELCEMERDICAAFKAMKGKVVPFHRRMK